MQQLPHPLPPAPLLEECFGYTNDARYMALFWEPSGDEAMVSDGMVTYASHSRPYLNYIGLLQRMGLEADLGCSEQVASDWLIVNLHERKLMSAPVMEARTFLDKQWPAPDSPANFTTGDLEALMENFFENLPEPDEPAMEDVENQLTELQGSWAELECWIANASMCLDPEWPAPFNLVDIFKEGGQELAEISAKWKDFIDGHEDEATDWMIELFDGLLLKTTRTNGPAIEDVAQVLADMFSNGDLSFADLGKHHAEALWSYIMLNFREWGTLSLKDMALDYFKQAA